jgi:ABC-type hemin transport system, periplasmic component
MKRFLPWLACLALVACGAQNSPGSSSDGDPGTKATAGSGAAAANPRELTGLSTVPAISDPVPVAGDFHQRLPVTVKDHEGNSVTVTDTSRILALDINGTLSRTVIALGHGDKLVGRTVSSTEKRLASLPVVTQSGHQLNAESIIALKPSVILADRSVGPPEAIDQLKATGIPVVLVDSHRSVASAGTLIKTIAHALGADDAGTALAKRTDGEIAAAKRQIAQWAPKQKLDVAFLYVRGTAGIFFILGKDDGATELIEGVGANDVASARGLASTTPASAEALVSTNPEVIFVMEQGLKSTNGLEGLMARPGVAQTRAGQKKRLVAIPDGVALAFGPQTGETLIAIARALYGVGR